MNLTDVFLNRPEILVDENKLKSVLSDYYSGDVRTINRMMKAYDLGIVDALSSGKDVDLEKKKIINRLVDLHDMQEEKATDAVTEWSKICTAKVLNTYKSYNKTRQEEQARAKDERFQKEQERKEKEDQKQKEQKLAEKQAGELSVRNRQDSR